MERLVIFDCDGVLVDSESLSLRALIECLEKFGVSRLESQFRPAEYRGAKLAVILQSIELETGKKLPTHFDADYRRRMDELFSTELREIAGVSNAIAKIPHKLCVASSGPLEKIKRSLKLAQLSHHFGENIFSSYTVQSWKPDPGIFLHAATQMRTEPRNCIVVEDAILGVQAAQRAGMKALALVPDGSVSEFVLLGARTFSSMNELPKLIDEAFSRN